MAGTLTAFGHVWGAYRVEEHNGFRCERTSLGYSERQHVDTRLPRYLRRRRPEANQGVGKTRTIHMNGKRTFMRDFGKCCDLIRAVDGSRLRCLRNGKCRSDHLVRAVSKSFS